jgi:hypothetical protein
MTVLASLAGIVVTLFAIFHLIRYINRSNILLCASAVRRRSFADDRLFRDLSNAIGGVKFVDQFAFPDAKKRRVTEIQALVPYQDGKEGLERWTVQHEADSCVYLVKLIPDGAGGTSFSVEKDG